MAAAQLPQEIWTHIFSFLSTADKMNIRSTCKLFKRVIDHHSLWKNIPVVLKKIGSYSPQFWTTLRRRKTSTAVVHKATVEEWKRLACLLPWLSSITLDLCVDAKRLLTLQRFFFLKRLVIRRCSCPSGFACVLVPLKQLTHLSICEVHRVPRSEVIGAVCLLTNLTSLSYHEGDRPIPKRAFHDILRSLPKLKHLSLKMGYMFGSLPDDYFCVTKTTHLPAEEQQSGELGLSHLELLDYMDPLLSPVALERLTSLQSLAVHYRDRALEPSMCHLRTWLSNLPQLSELIISQGYPLSVYAHSIPATVRNLSLIRVMTECPAVRTLGEHVPDLLHLRFDPCCHDNGESIAAIPLLFPRLQTLMFRHHNVMEKEFLRLQRLRRLVILDAHPGPSPFLKDVTEKLQVQTNNRVQVIHSLGQRDPTACLCNHY